MNRKPPMDCLFLDEAATRLAITKEGLRRHLKRGNIPFQKYYNKIIIKKEVVDELAKQANRQSWPVKKFLDVIDLVELEKNRGAMVRPFYTVSQAALEIGVSRRTLYNWIRDGIAFPDRTEKGLQSFTRDEISRLKKVKRNISGVTDYDRLQKILELAQEGNLRAQQRKMMLCEEIFRKIGLLVTADEDWILTNWETI